MRSVWILLVAALLAGCSQPDAGEDGTNGATVTITPGPFATTPTVDDTPNRPTPSNETRAEWTMGLTSAGPVSEANVKTYSVASVDPGTKYGWMALVLDGSNLSFASPDGCTLGPVLRWWACTGATALSPVDDVTPGDTISLRGSSTHIAGKRIQFVDTETGRVKLTLTVD